MKNKTYKELLDTLRDTSCLNVSPIEKSSKWEVRIGGVQRNSVVAEFDSEDEADKYVQAFYSRRRGIENARQTRRFLGI